MVGEGGHLTASAVPPSTFPTTVPITSSGSGGTTTTGGLSPVVTGAPVTVPPTTSPPPTVVLSPPSAGVSDTLACIRSYEQGAAVYATNTGNGHYGAYQFNQATWDGAVARAGYPEWSGRRASDAPPEVQDAAAAQLLSERGLQPWPTPNRLCG